MCSNICPDICFDMWFDMYLVTYFDISGVMPDKCSEICCETRSGVYLACVLTSVLAAAREVFWHVI